jgi:hypothetical protein
MWVRGDLRTACAVLDPLTRPQLLRRLELVSRRVSPRASSVAVTYGRGPISVG